MLLLPDEIWWEIMLYLELKDLFCLILTNKRFYWIQKNDNFWKEQVKNRFKLKSYESKILWKEEYKTLKEMYQQIRIYIKKYLNKDPIMINREYDSISYDFPGINNMMKFKQKD